MCIWQPHVALPSAKLMMAALEEGISSHIRLDAWKHFEESGQSLHYVDFATRSMPPRRDQLNKDRDNVIIPNLRLAV